MTIDSCPSYVATRDKNAAVFEQVDAYRKLWRTNFYANGSREEGVRYRVVMFEYLDALSSLKVVMREHLSDQVGRAIDNGYTHIVVAVIVFGIIVVLTPVLVYLMHNLTTSIQVRTLCQLSRKM